MKRLIAISASMLLISVAHAQTFTSNVIIQGSECVGFDCVTGESFGFDTIRLKENNLRIKFQDTSTSASFPSTDWQIRINDSSNGGDNYFAVEDVTGGRTPFLIRGGAPNNALYVDAQGDVGMGTSTPVVEAHIVDGDTPTLRLEQNSSSGWTPQTWDLAGNETNFFVRDVTNGSKLPFRIRPNTASNTIDMNSNGVGIRTTSADADLHVIGDIRVEPADTGGTTGAALDVRETASSRPAANFQHSDGGAFSIVAAFASTATTGNHEGGILRVSTDQTAATNANVVLMNLVNAGGEVFKVFNDGRVEVNTTQVHPDYVFKPGYELMPLDELKTFVTQNQHLPNIPTADDVRENGLDITGLSVRLLEKVEELTLYTISQQEQIDRLIEENRALRSVQ